MDVQMPVMDGYAATHWIRARERERKRAQARENQLKPGKRSQTANPEAVSDVEQQDIYAYRSPSLALSLPTKIIALTAYAFDEDRTRSLHAGCDDYLAKPFDAEDLLEKVGHHLGVKYCYTESVMADDQAIAIPQSLTREDLQGLPLDWRQAAREAALDLNDQALRQLIDQIYPDHEPLAAALICSTDVGSS